MPVIVGGSTTVVVQDRRPRTQVTARPNTAAVANPSAELVAVQQPSAVEIGSNIGRRGPKGAPGDSVPAIAWAFGDAPGTVWTPTDAGVLVGVRLAVETALNGTAPTITIGTAADPVAAMDADLNDPATIGEYETTPDLHLAAGEAVRMTITSGASSAGGGHLYLTFLPD